MADAIAAIGLQQENEAKALFRQGIECEREGNPDEATRCYKRALRLDPDVEKKIPNEDAAISIDTNDHSDESEDKFDKNVNLFLRFQRIIGPQLCFPRNEPRRTHFSALPPELVIYIFRWVVSDDLDLRILERCSAVCRGWYLCARDPELWRRACSKFWASNVNDLVQFDGSWRRMFIERPNVLTIGVYVSRVSYVRKGEVSFRDNSNGPPTFQVDNYRYLRFFPDGRVIMSMSFNSPAKITRSSQSMESLLSLGSGHYRLSGNRLFLKLISSDKPQTTHRKTIYMIVLEISEYIEHGCYKHNWKLEYKNYKIAYHTKPMRQIVTKCDLPNVLYPPFIFSPVKCYESECQRIL